MRAFYRRYFVFFLSGGFLFLTFNVVPHRHRLGTSICNCEKNVEECKIGTRKDKILRCNSPPLIILKKSYPFSFNIQNNKKVMKE